MYFSKNLKSYIKKNNLSLKEFAEKLDVSVSTLHGWLNDIPPKNIKIIKKVANLMDCSIDELCFGEKIKDNFIDSNIVIKSGTTSYQVYVKEIEEE